MDTDDAQIITAKSGYAYIDDPEGGSDLITIAPRM